MTYDFDRLIGLALAGSVGMTLVILACALQPYEWVNMCNQKQSTIQLLSCSCYFSSWWPFIVVLFYVFSIFPTVVQRRFDQDSMSGTSPCLELAIFVTMGFVVSSYALPIVLARTAAVNISMMIDWNFILDCSCNFIFRFCSTDQIRSMLFDTRREHCRLFYNFRLLPDCWQRQLRWNAPLNIIIFKNSFHMHFSMYFNNKTEDILWMIKEM